MRPICARAGLSRETGLTAPQLAILQAIADLGEVTTGRISADVSLSQATVTVILDRLVERAWSSATAARTTAASCIRA